MMDRKPLEQAGFNEDQIEALIETFSPRGHHHDIEDVEDLRDELDDLQPEESEEDEEE